MGALLSHLNLNPLTWLPRALITTSERLCHPSLTDFEHASSCTFSSRSGLFQGSTRGIALSCTSYCRSSLALARLCFGTKHWSFPPLSRIDGFFLPFFANKHLTLVIVTQPDAVKRKRHNHGNQRLSYPAPSCATRPDNQPPAFKRHSRAVVGSTARTLRASRRCPRNNRARCRWSDRPCRR